VLKLLVTALQISALLTAATIGADADPTRIAVGIYPSYPPLDMRDPVSGELMGFDIELSKRLAQKLGAVFDLQETAFAQLLPSVQTGRIKLFFNGMNDTAPRRELIGFVDYLRSGTQFLVRAADAGAYPDETALCGRKVAGSRSTSLPGQIAAWSQAHCESQGRAALVFLGADNNIDARSQLRQERVDAMAQDSLTIPFVQSKEPGVYQPVGEPFEMTIMGIGVDKGDTALQHSIAQALQAMIDDGSYAALLKDWGLPASSAIARATVNGAP
jgi:polar amino acid transport system substrate-binding protein